MLSHMDAQQPQSPQAERNRPECVESDRVLPEIRLNSLTPSASLDGYENAPVCSVREGAACKRLGGYEEYTFVEAAQNVVFKDWTDTELDDWEITKERQWFFHQQRHPQKFGGLDDLDPNARAASMKNKYTAWYTAWLKRLCKELVKDPAERNFDCEIPQRFLTAPQTRSFRCEAPRMLAVEKRYCCTGQEYFPAQEQSRPVASHHHGRNGSNFRQIPKEYRVLWCRKCYQHVRDRLVNNLGRREYALVQLEVIARQIRKLETWVPQGRYCIGLQISFRTKYNQFLLRRTETTDREAAQLVNDIWRMDHKERGISEHKNAVVIEGDSRWFPVDMAEELLPYCSINSTSYDKTSEDILALVNVFRQWLLEGRCEVVAPVEFLLAEQPMGPPIAKRRSLASITERQFIPFTVHESELTRTSSHRKSAPAEVERGVAPKKRKRSAWKSSNEANPEAAAVRTSTGWYPAPTKLNDRDDTGNNLIIESGATNFQYNRTSIRPHEALSSISGPTEDLQREASSDLLQNSTRNNEDADPPQKRKLTRSYKKPWSLETADQAEHPNPEPSTPKSRILTGWRHLNGQHQARNCEHKPSTRHHHRRNTHNKHHRQRNTHYKQHRVVLYIRGACR